MVCLNLEIVHIDELMIKYMFIQRVCPDSMMFFVSSFFGWVTTTTSEVMMKSNVFDASFVPGSLDEDE